MFSILTVYFTVDCVNKYDLINQGGEDKCAFSVCIASDKETDVRHMHTCHGWLKGRISVGFVF